MTRRGWLTRSAGAIGSATMLCACGQLPLATAPTPASARRVDVHHHVMPPIWLKEAGTQIAAKITISSVNRWSLQRSLDDMDANGIATAIASVTAPGIWFGDVALGRRLARGCNEYMAQIGRDHPGRFGSFAALPLPDIEGCLAEIDYALGTLKAEGFGLMTSYDNKWPGDPAFAPVFEELNRRKAVVYFHPTNSDCCAAQLPGVSMSAIEFPIDTTRAVTSLLYSGGLSRWRDIRWIISHGGAAIPPLAHRIAANVASRKDLADRIPSGALAELQRLYYDTALAANPVAMGGLLKLVSPGQVLFGTDFPFGVSAPTIKGLQDLALSPADMDAIEQGNARALMPRLGTRA